jgi:hypothetical protein
VLLFLKISCGLTLNYLRTPPASNDVIVWSVKGGKSLKILTVLFKILSRVGVTYKTGFGLVIGFIDNRTRDYRQYSAIAILHTFQFTVTHALGFLVFTSRILATDLSQFHFNFKSHMKSSCHSLIPFLSFLLNHHLLPSPELDPIPILAA